MWELLNIIVCIFPTGRKRLWHFFILFQKMGLRIFSNANFIFAEIFPNNIFFSFSPIKNFLRLLAIFHKQPKWKGFTFTTKANYIIPNPSFFVSNIEIFKYLLLYEVFIIVFSKKKLRITPSSVWAFIRLSIFTINWTFSMVWPEKWYWTFNCILYVICVF